jgi:D-arabinose 1-dehydrogenase-like Zn-dependent alcohol dehydrogenase
MQNICRWQKQLASDFDLIIDTVSAPHDYNTYHGLLCTNGVMICLGFCVRWRKSCR